MGIIGIWHIANSYASFKSKLIDKLTGSSPTVLVKNGRIQHKALARERLNEEELWSGLRLMDVDNIKEVQQATLEPNGQISVLLEDWAKPAQKQDLPRLKQPAKAKA
jgi:uncharacterized membrane protein YcaP (DUF421 family)